MTAETEFGDSSNSSAIMALISCGVCIAMSNVQCAIMDVKPLGVADFVEIAVIGNVFLQTDLFAANAAHVHLREGR